MSELFQLVGKIVIDTTEANKAIDATMANVKALNEAMGGQSGSTSGGTSGKSSVGSSSSTPISTSTSTSSENQTAAGVATGNLAADAFSTAVNFFSKNAWGGVETGLNKQGATASLSAFIGEQGAEYLYQELLDYSLNSTLGIDMLLNNAKTLLGQNMPYEDVLETIRFFGDVSMGNAERANSMLWNYAQVMSRGKMDAQDEKDFAKSGFSVPSILADMTGTTAAEWKERMSKEGINPDYVKAALEYATSEGGTFYGQMEKVMGSAYGQAEKTKNLWEQLWANIADPFTDFLGNVGLPVGNWVLEKAVDNKHATNFTLNALGGWLAQAMKTTTFGTNAPGFLGKLFGLVGSNTASNILGAASGLGMVYSIYDYGVEAREETEAQRWARHDKYATAAEGVENMNAGRNPVFMPTLQNAARILGEYWQNEDFNSFADEAEVIQKLFGFDNGQMGYDPEKMNQINNALRTMGFEGNPFTGESMDMIDLEMWLNSLGTFFQELNMQTPEQQNQLGQLSSKMDTMNSNMSTTNSLLATIAANSNQTIVLDSGVVVGALAPDMNGALGDLVNQNERGG